MPTNAGTQHVHGARALELHVLESSRVTGRVALFGKSSFGQTSALLPWRYKCS